MILCVIHVIGAIWQNRSIFGKVTIEFQEITAYMSWPLNTEAIEGSSPFNF